MSLRKFAVSSNRPVFCLALILILAVGALASGIGIVFQGFETDTSLWFNIGLRQEIVQEPSGYTDGGGYASGIASATGNYHARLVVDTTQCNYGEAAHHPILTAMDPTQTGTEFM